ncbi:hemerythrin domain-containing protein [Altererythrobacter sp. H2]|uniref:hemerythrin domain-containing protein n=1 Tax=Altererythrobacter sp. H2 TaxID=3108391 RepID=UPI002B4C0120|nr:hemerythrin domain-containing protein [Altererythrobacter sp. H2]WRK96706.1 hemerythrin domain-containing protein [Altererythrobacter sp. H2]
MSFLDRIAAAVTPAASDEQRAEARRNVERLAAGEPWLRAVVDQHKQIEAAFNEARQASGPGAVRAVEQLSTLLTGHATAEEAVLYPDVAEFSGKTHAGMAYEEHAMTKIQLAKLKQLDPGSEEWREKLEHIEGAVQQHVYQEESEWLPDLVDNLPRERKAFLTQQYEQEYSRYMGDGETTMRMEPAAGGYRV